MKALAIVLAPLLLVGACASSEQITARLLDQRLEARLRPDIQAGRALVQPLPGAARVVLLDTSSLSIGSNALDDKYPDVRANMIEGMLDPSLMRVQIADSSALSGDQRETRVRNLQNYFAANGLQSVLTDVALPQDGTTPAGLTITFRVKCPSRTDYSNFGYGSGRADPRCE